MIIELASMYKSVLQTVFFVLQLPKENDGYGSRLKPTVRDV